MWASTTRSALPLRVDDRQLVSFVLNRKGRDFSDRDCALLELMRVHLARWYTRARELDAGRRAAAALQALLARTDGAIVRVDAQRRLSDAAPQALLLLAGYGVGPLQGGAALPAVLDHWLASLAAMHEPLELLLRARRRSAADPRRA